MNIIVVGEGQWGTAIGALLKKNKKRFEFWSKKAAIPNNSIVIMCIPTQAIRGFLEKHARFSKNLIYINGAKGIERGTHKLPFQIAMDILNKNTDYFSLIGPSFAQEVVRKMPTLVNIGYTKDKNTELVRDLFQTDYFRVRLTKGIRALELASAFKNIYAIACGLATGLGFETNTRVKLILLAIEEFYILSKKLGYKIDRRALPGTIGDLILTCNSEESRNFSFGKLLVKYRKDEALKKIGETVEGYYTVDSVPHLERETGVELPLAQFVFGILQENNPSKVELAFAKFVKNT